CVIFFFSSRRRHTRWPRDWSSDVCSSDLQAEGRDSEPCLVVDLEVVRENYNTFAKALPDARVFYAVKANPAPEVLALLASLGSRSEERRVGKEVRFGGRAEHEKRSLETVR